MWNLELKSAMNAYLTRVFYWVHKGYNLQIARKLAEIEIAKEQK